MGAEGADSATLLHVDLLGNAHPIWQQPHRGVVAGKIRLRTDATSSWEAADLTPTNGSLTTCETGSDLLLISELTSLSV